jgi:23S rRNA-/tRNA-specific pseudouridylate synthase
MYRVEEPIEGGFASIKRAVGDPEADGAVRAVTRFRVLAAGGGHSLVLCEPVTGRTHQLRVHLSHLGHPILGDDLYGEASSLMARHALHALSLSVPMPFSRMREDVSEAAIPFAGCADDCPLNTPSPDGFLHTWAPLPDDMGAVIRSLFPKSLVLAESPTVELLRSLTLSET